MIVRLYARGVGNTLMTREFQIGDSLVYYDDRQPGIRLTVLLQDTLKVIHDKVYNTHYHANVILLEAAIKKYNLSTNILILTSSGSSNGNQWISGFNNTDFIFFAANGFKKLNKGLMSYVQPTYAAIKNNNAQDIVEVSDTHVPSTVSLYAKSSKSVLLQSPMSILNPNNKIKQAQANLLAQQKSTVKNSVSMVGATESKTGKAGIGFSIGGIAATIITGLALYKIMEKK